MRVRIFTITVALLFAGCHHNNGAFLIGEAAHLLQSRPDSSLSLMRSINPDCLMTQRQKAKYALYLSAALDKNFIDMSSDSLISIATSYYSSSGDIREQMMTWYYDGLVRMNMNSYPSAVISFEKALQKAKSLKRQDSRYLGLIYRSIATCFHQTNNLSAAIDYYIKAVDSFSEAPADSLYLLYAKRALATEYYSNGDYDKALQLVNQTMGAGNKNYQDWAHVLYSALLISRNKDYESGIAAYLKIPRHVLSYHDYIRIALAYDNLGKRDSSDYWIDEAYIHAKNKADSATIDYTYSKICLHRGKDAEAYRLLDNASTVQDSLIRVKLNESISSSQRDYFMEVAKEREEKHAQALRLGLLLGVIGLLLTCIFFTLLIIRSLRKEQLLKELMAQLAVNNQNVIQLSRENASLLATHYSERIRNIDSISRDYYQADSKDKKDIVFKQFKDYISVLANDDTFYESLENELNKYCSGIMSRLRVQVPKIQGNNLKLIALFYAGLSYETVAIITKAQSINSLKTQRSRFRKIIEESSAKDKSFFLQMLEMKRQQVRKTN